MKFSSAIIVLAAVATQAAAVREQDEPFFKGGIGHCGTAGEKCHEVKRAASHVAEALKHAPTGKPTNSYFCAVEGSSGCNEKWNAVAKIGAAAEKAHEAITRREAEADAEAAARGRIWYCGVDGEACAKKRDVQTYCDVPGSNCEAKREAKSWKHSKEGTNSKISYCGVPGEACMRKRDAAPDAYRWSDYCKVPGSKCETELPKHHVARDAEARGRIWYCGVDGEACAKKRETTEAQDAIRAAHPKAESNECHEDGQPCDLIHKAHAAFRSERRDAEARGRIWYCGVDGEACARKRDVQFKSMGAQLSTPAKAHLLHPDEQAKSAAEKACHGPEGACRMAARALDELEAAINEGLEQVNSL